MKYGMCCLRNEFGFVFKYLRTGRHLRTGRLSWNYRTVLNIPSPELGTWNCAGEGRMGGRLPGVPTTPSYPRPAL